LEKSGSFIFFLSVLAVGFAVVFAVVFAISFAFEGFSLSPVFSFCSSKFSFLFEM